MSTGSITVAGRRVRRLSRFNLPGSLFMVGLVCLWQLADSIGAIRLEFLASPIEIFAGAADLFSIGLLQSSILHTAIASVTGWLIGAAIGVALGILVGLSPRAWKWSMASFEFLRAIPGVTLAPLAVLLFGFSLEMELTLIIFVATWDVMIATSEATRKVPHERLELARALNMSRVDVIRKVILPSAADVIITALRISLAVAIAIAIVAEIVGNPAGIGFEMINAQNSLNAGRTFAFVISAGLLGLLLCGGFEGLTRRIFPGITASSEQGVAQ